jgi:hypothetical protein
LLNVALIVAPMPTPVAPAVGVVDTTSGGVVSGILTVSWPHPTAKRSNNDATNPMTATLDVRIDVLCRRALQFAYERPIVAR